jgi:hypothetical protein
MKKQVALPTNQPNEQRKEVRRPEGVRQSLSVSPAVKSKNDVRILTETKPECKRKKPQEKGKKAMFRCIREDIAFREKIDRHSRFDSPVVPDQPEDA